MKQLFNLEEIECYKGLCGIYRIKVNEKEYLGSSSNIFYRLKHHVWALKSLRHHNSTMKNLFTKYGMNSFLCEVIEECLPEDLINREKYYIDTLKPYINHILDPVKITRSEQYKNNISTGLKNAYSKGLRPHNDKLVHQYDRHTGEYMNTFQTVSLAVRSFLKTDPAAICNCARGETYTAYGFRWSYQKVKKLSDIKTDYKIRGVVQCSPITGESIKIWDSISEAQTQLGINNIHRAASNNKKAGGFKWKFHV